MILNADNAELPSEYCKLTSELPGTAVANQTSSSVIKCGFAVLAIVSSIRVSNPDAVI